MKILVTTPYFQPHTGGSQRYIEDLYAEVMAQNPQVNVDVLTYNTDHVSKKEVYRGMHVYRLGCWEILPGQFAVPNYFELLFLLRKLQRENYDLVNAHTRFFDNAFWSPLLAKIIGAKALFTDHTAASPAHDSKIVSMITKTIDFFGVPILNLMYPRATVVSEATRRYIQHKGFRKPITIVPGGISLDTFETARKSSQESSWVRKITGDTKVVTFVGRMISAKGPQRLLEAVTPLIEKDKNIQVFFAGDGELLETLKQCESDQISFLGRLSKAEVAHLLIRSDILVHPSSHHEGLPITLLEAGAARCAVIATDRGGVTEVIQDKKTGIISSTDVTDIRKALSFLLGDQKERERLSKNLHNLINERYTWESIAADFIEKVLT